MCGGYSCLSEHPRHLTEINGQTVVGRTIELLKDCGITDIAITTTGKGFDVFNVPVICYNSIKKPYSWVDCFYLTDEPTCYIFGDVFYSRAAIRKIVNTATNDIEFFASAPPFSKDYAKKFAEPFAFKVFDTKHFKEAIGETKRLQKKGKFERSPIAWELWQVIKGTKLNCIDYTNYSIINDFTCDVDIPQDAGTIRTLIKFGVLEDDV